MFELWKNSSYRGSSYREPTVHSSIIFLFFLSDTEGKWLEEDTLDAHSDWVRDVAFAPNCGQENFILATCSLVSNKTFCSSNDVRHCNGFRLSTT